MATQKFRYLIALGSNTGVRLQMLRDAAKEVALSIGPVTAFAGIYETEPIGAADSLFLNSALTVTTDLPPPALMQELLAIEQKLGRVRAEKWGNRTIDLDILLAEEEKPLGSWNQIVTASPNLSLPHPEMLKRSFVMLPAVDVASDWVHPLVHLKLADALKKHLPTAEIDAPTRTTQSWV